MTTSDDLVIGSGGGVGTGTWTCRDEVSGLPDSAPEVAKGGTDADNMGLEGTPGFTTRPQPSAPEARAELCSGWALPAAIPRSPDP